MTKSSSLRSGRSKSRIMAALLVLLFLITALFLNLGNQARNNGASIPLPSSKSAEVLVFPQSSTTPDTLEGCLKCHDKIEPMHRFGPTATLDKLDHGKDALGLTCTACHGGNPIATEKDSAHVRPKFPREWQQNGKFKIPERSGPLLAREGPEFVRFVNPGDLRVANKTCDSSECHSTEASAASNSMMRHGAMLWGAALYNNGGFPIKDTNFGESYSADGAPQRLIQIPPPTAEQRRFKGVLSFLDPLPRCFFFNDTATTEIYTLSLHDALPTSRAAQSTCERRASLVSSWKKSGMVAGSGTGDRKSTRLNSSHGYISYAVFC